LIQQPQGLQTAAFERFEIAFDSSRIPHAYKTFSLRKGYFILCESQ
jgi:hypothetical protein